MKTKRKRAGFATPTRDDYPIGPHHNVHPSACIKFNYLPAKNPSLDIRIEVIAMVVDQVY